MIAEVSGITDSKNVPGHIWAEEDSGNPPELTLIRHDGTVVHRVYLKGITNRDWEDLGLYGNQLYLAETGDNNGTHASYHFYRFNEPDALTDTVRNIEDISFTYEDGPHDAEAFLIEPSSGAILVITKRDIPSRVYRISHPVEGVNTAVLSGTLPYSGVVSAAMSADGKEIIVKTYTDLYYYPVNQGTIAQALQNQPGVLHYVVEVQGEAVCFAQDGSGFFTLSEKGFGNTVKLYFYRGE
jgi:hypothetical protein